MTALWTWFFPLGLHRSGPHDTGPHRTVCPPVVPACTGIFCLRLAWVQAGPRLRVRLRLAGGFAREGQTEGRAVALYRRIQDEIPAHPTHQGS